MNTLDITTFKNNIFDTLQSWIDERIDSLVENNPRLQIASVYIKRGVKNYILREHDKINSFIDNATLFLCDESGSIDTETLFNDMMNVFCDMEEVPFGKGFIQGTIGKGTIRFALPNNPVVNILFGDTGAIKITEADILELKRHILTHE